MTEKIRSNVPRDQWDEILHNFGAAISGRATDDYEIREPFWGRFAQKWWEQVETAFHQKSKGGRDKSGEKWKKLSKKYVAYQRTPNLVKAGFGGKRFRGLLTERQNNQWKGIYSGMMRVLIPKIGLEAAKILSAKIAWTKLKQMGAHTKIAEFGGRKVPIGVKSGKLAKAVRPGRMVRRYIPPANQLFSLEMGHVLLGVDLPYAANFHKKRRLWPARRKRKQWMVNCARAARAEIVRRMKEFR